MSHPQNAGIADNATLRKARGAFFTPREISDFIVEWGVHSRQDLTLEPSCGEASFLLSAGERLKALGYKSDRSSSPLNGIEIHDVTAHQARHLLESAGVPCTIQIADFFDVAPNPVYDVVLGNPPYVRYQDFSGRARTKGLEAALAQGVRFNLLANSWAPFVIHAAQFVKPNGRLGLVLPAELLSVKYASQVRRFLLDRFASIKLVMFDELVFPDVLEEVVLLLAEGTGPTTGFELCQARNLVDLESRNRKTWKRFTPAAVDKWTSALLTSNALDTYRKIIEDDCVETLLDWGESYLGAVTGNNRFFTLTASQVHELNLKSADLVAISPPGSRHLRGLTFTSSAWAELSSQGSRCHLFYPRNPGQSEEVAKYISLGEESGVQKAYKCRVRKPWWRVPLAPIPDLFLTYMDYACPRLITNEADLYHLNSVYGVCLKADRCKLGRDLLPLSSMNSLTLLGAEIVGRAYGGGILKLEPNEADQLPLLSEPLLQAAANELRNLRPQVSVDLRKGEMSRVVKAVDAILLKRHLGLKNPEITRLRSAREALFSRRVNRSRRT